MNDLLQACQQGQHAAVVAALHSMAAQPGLQAAARATDAHGWCPHLWAVRHGWVDVIEQLALLGAPADGQLRSSGNTALHIAAVHGQLAVLKQLLSSSGLAVDIRNKNGDTPLLFAVSMGHCGCAAALLQAGADPAAANACGLNAALAAASHGRLLELRLLERHMGAPAWQQLLACSKDKHGATPLHFAASSGHAEVVAALLAAGCDVFARNGAGATPRQLAERHQQPAAASVLAAAEEQLAGAAQAAAARLLDDAIAVPPTPAQSLPAAAGKHKGGRLKQKKETPIGTTIGKQQIHAEAGGGQEAEAEGSTAAQQLDNAVLVQEQEQEQEPAQEQQQVEGSTFMTDSSQGSLAATAAAAVGGDDAAGWEVVGSKRLQRTAAELPQQQRQQRQSQQTQPLPQPTKPPAKSERGTAATSNSSSNLSYRSVVGNRRRGAVPAAGSAPASRPADPVPPAAQQPASPASSAGLHATIPVRDPQQRVADRPPLPPQQQQQQQRPLEPEGQEGSEQQLVAEEEGEGDWVGAAVAWMAEAHPAAAALDLQPRHVCGLGVEGLSAAQLDALEVVHRRALVALADVRLALAQQQHAEAEAEAAARAAERQQLRQALAAAAAVQQQQQQD